MSVVGFDIGTFKSSIGIAKQGGVEIIDNDYSDRITPTYVSFTNRQRFQGHAAKQQEITNFKNTISNFKRLLGCKYQDPQVHIEQQFTELRISPANDDNILFNVNIYLIFFIS
jgi:molecular chaperone DnaK (HSP70)